MVQPAPRLWLSIVSWARAWPMLSWELSFITSKHDTSAHPQQITSKTTAKVVKLTKSSITVQNYPPTFHLKHNTVYSESAKAKGGVYLWLMRAVWNFCICTCLCFCICVFEKIGRVEHLCDWWGWVGLCCLEPIVNPEPWHQCCFFW